MATDALIARYNQPVPRYTSFPTAAQFHALEAAPYAAALTQIAPTEQLSLYLHVPFCASLCHYCGCHTEITTRRSKLAEFTTQLQQEIALVTRLIGRRQPVSHIHFGGGTPNYLSPQQSAALFATLRQHFACDEAAIAIECDPRLLTQEHIATYAREGVTRVSLGIQDSDPVVQQAIHRIQPIAQVRAVVQQLRDHGITQINFDLILGLPNQTAASVSATLAEVIALRPPRVAVFPYAHVPWMKPQQKLLERFPMPDAGARHAMGLHVAATLQDAGYLAIGMDHFALPDDRLAIRQREGKLRRNFQGYTDDTSDILLGFGPSSISQFPHLFAQNTPDRTRYAAALAAHTLPTARGCHRTDDEARRSRLIERLLCDFAVDWAADAMPPAAAPLAQMLADGLVTREGTALRITPRGRPFARSIATLFDPGYQPQEGRHAQAI